MADNKFAALEELMRELNDVEQDIRLKLLVSIMTDAEMRGFADRMRRMFPRDAQ